MDFHFGQKRFGVASVSAGRRGNGGPRRELNRSMRVRFHVTADTVQKDGIMYAWRNTCGAPGERRGAGEPRRGALVRTLDL